jgi:Flp pilus assembly protein TadD
MCRKPPPTATALAAFATALAIAAPASAWPFGAKPAASPAPVAASTQPSAAQSSVAQSSATQPGAAQAGQKASARERAAAARLEPLARSVFWAREADLDPTDTEAGIELAASLRALGRFQEATDAVGKVLVLYPNNLDALLEAARDHVADGKGFYALDPLHKAQAIAPKDWRVYSLMAVARDQNRQPDEARAAYEQALALSPDNPAVLSNLGLWCVVHGKSADGEAYLRRAAAQPGATAQERQNLALVLGMEGKFTEAEHLMRDDLPPDIADANMDYLHAVAKGAAPNPLTTGLPGGGRPIAQAR